MATAPKNQRLNETTPKPDQQVSHPFSDPTNDADLILLVEEQKLYVNKAVLSLASPVFKTMFEADFKEKSSKEIYLPEKKFEYFHEFLLCIYPSTCKAVTRENLDTVLPLAHEYQVKQLVDRCEEFVLNRFKMEEEKMKNPSLKELVHFLLLAEKYDLNRLLNVCSEKMAPRAITMYFVFQDSAEKYEEFGMLSHQTKCEICFKRLRLLESLAYRVAKGISEKDELLKTCFRFDG